MTCAVGYFFVSNENKLQDGRQIYEVFGRCLKPVKQALLYRHWKPTLSVYRVRKTCRGQVLNGLGSSAHGFNMGFIWYKSDCHCLFLV